jgi:hypothetical protein
LPSTTAVSQGSQLRKTQALAILPVIVISAASSQ